MDYFQPLIRVPELGEWNLSLVSLMAYDGVCVHPAQKASNILRRLMFAVRYSSRIRTRERVSHPHMWNDSTAMNLTTLCCHDGMFACTVPRDSTNPCTKKGCMSFFRVRIP